MAPHDGASVRGKLEAMDAKLEMLLVEFREYKVEATQKHVDHKKWTSAIDTRVTSLETWRTWLAGAGAVMACAGYWLSEEIKAKIMGKK